MPPYNIAKTVLLMPNFVAPIPTSNGYNNLYSLDSDDDPVIEEIVDSKTLNPINTSYVVTQLLTLSSTPIKAIKTQHKIRGRTRISTINQT